MGDKTKKAKKQQDRATKRAARKAEREERQDRGLGRQVRQLIPHIAAAVILAETELGAGTAGAKKMRRAAEFLAGVIDLPFVPEFLETMIFHILICTLVEVAMLVWGDKVWAKRLEDEMGLGDVGYADFGMDEEGA